MLEITISTLSIVVSILSIITLLIQLTVSRINFKNKNFDEDLYENLKRINVLSERETLINNERTLQKIITSQALISAVMIISKGNIELKVNGIKKTMQTEEKKKNGVIISALFLELKLKKLHKTYLALSIASLLSFVLSVPYTISAIICLLLIFSITYQLLLSYRIKNGLFGNNPYEAKELLEFIIQNDDKIGSDGNGIFNEEVIHEIVIDFSELARSGGKLDVI